jgi:glutathione S-transferase
MPSTKAAADASQFLCIVYPIMLTLYFYHAAVRRSLRVLGTLEEMGLAYEPVPAAHVPPRVLCEIVPCGSNPLGTVPFFARRRGPHDRVERHLPLSDLALMARHPLQLAEERNETMARFPQLLRFFADATLTFPQTIVLALPGASEPPERRNERSAADYERWSFGSARARGKSALSDRTRNICGADRFNHADTAIAIRSSFWPSQSRVGSATASAQTFGLSQSTARARPAFHQCHGS